MLPASVLSMYCGLLTRTTRVRSFGLFPAFTFYHCHAKSWFYTFALVVSYTFNIR